MQLTTGPAEIDYRLLFRSLPGFYLAISPQHTILALSNRYLHFIGLPETDLIGQPVSVICGHLQPEAAAEYTQKWQHSLDYVLTHRQAHTMAVACYTQETGEQQQSYWEAVNTPVLTDAGEVAYIIYEARNITHAHLLALKVQQTEERYVAINQATNDAIWDWDLRQNTITWNESYKTLFGFTQIDAMPSSRHDFIHPEDRDRVNQSIQEVIQNGGKFWSDEYRFRCADGSYSDILDRGYVLQDENGGPYRMVGSMQDVTLQKKTEQQLKESSDFFQFLADTVPAFIWTSEPDGTTDYRNEYYLNFVGRGIASRPGFHWSELLPPGEREMIAADWQQDLRSGCYFEKELRIRHRDGEYRWVLARANPKLNAQGKIIKWLGTATDIHAHKMAQLALAESYQRFKFLADMVPALIWTSNPDGTTDYRNQNYYRFIGDASAERPDFDWTEPLHPDDRAETYKRWAEAVRTGRIFQIEHRLWHHSGEYRWILSRSEAMRDQNGRIVKWFGSSADIHDQKITQENLQEANAELKRINEDLDRFVYTASHDLKLPIINMGSLFGEIMTTCEFKDPDHDKLVQLFYKSLDQINATITDLSEIAKVQKNSHAEKEEINLPELTEEVCLSIQDLVQSSGARIITDFTAAPQLEFSKANLRSILYNLISNSLKYRSPDRVPEIKVATAQTPEFVVLTVQDNGLGINLDLHKEKLFQMFKRFHSHISGTGLGLYMINRIMQNNNGHVEVESNTDEGSTFRIYFRKN